jgi:hypothetical protein
MTTRTANRRDVRKHFVATGHEVMIDRYGHVFFRKEGDAHWLEGRWVDEYVIDDNGNVHHVN